MHYINGEWISGGGKAFMSENPATGETLWRGEVAETQQVEAAVSAARAAFDGWANTPLQARIAILTRFRDRLKERKAELSRLISEETGKAAWDADSEAAATIGKLTFTLAAYDERTPSKRTELSAATAQLTHHPHGVMAVYGPYNFPAHLPNGHIMPALLAGNTVVFKPSELTPSVGEWMMQQWHEAGLPSGVLNLVQGEKDTGIALSRQPINGVLFTGSVSTGRKLHELFAGRPEIIVALELGGNAPLIIDTISDIKSAVLETILSAFVSSGQRCTCARRLIVVGKQPELIAALTEAMATIVVGTFTDSPPPFMGPVISNAAADALLARQDAWINLGAKPIILSRRLHENRPFLSPGLIDTTGVDTPDEEAFGPLLQLIHARDIAEAITLAGNTRYGLAAGLFSDNPEHFALCQRRLKVGILNWNQQTTGASGIAPFGGVGISGNHRPAGYYAADYCAYPVASMQRETLSLPESLPPGLRL